MSLLRLLLVFAIFLLACGVDADDRVHWSAELLIGDAYNADSATHIKHETLGDVAFTGDYQTRGFEGPFHYAWRVARWDEDRGWELQLLHHKLYLQNRPTGVDLLSVSHGFNILTFNRALQFGSWRVRGGVGPVITHAEATILGTSYDGPYELAGAAVLVGVDRKVQLSTRLYVLGELAATYGYVHAHPDGTPRLELTIRNPAIHAQLGVGYRF
jgi:hypothetical protein